MQEEVRAIEALVFVTKLSLVPEHEDKTEGRVSGFPFVPLCIMLAGSMSAVE
jgi:hypothetical protein